MMSLGVRDVAFWTPEQGSPSTSGLPRAMSSLCRGSRAAAHVMQALAERIDPAPTDAAWVLSTGAGEPGVLDADPHHALERDLVSLFSPSLPAITFSGGPSMITAALLECEMLLAAGHRSAIWLSMDMTAGAELATAMVFGLNGSKARIVTAAGAPMRRARSEWRFAANPSGAALELALGLRTAFERGEGSMVQVAPGREHRDPVWVEILPAHGG